MSYADTRINWPGKSFLLGGEVGGEDSWIGGGYVFCSTWDFMGVKLGVPLSDHIGVVCCLVDNWGTCIGSVRKSYYIGQKLNRPCTIKSFDGDEAQTRTIFGWIFCFCWSIYFIHLEIVKWSIIFFDKIQTLSIKDKNKFRFVRQKMSIKYNENRYKVKKRIPDANLSIHEEETLAIGCWYISVWTDSKSC